MAVTFVKGSPEVFVSKMGFSLNFDDKKIKSVKVKPGESLLYDGHTATYPMEGKNQTSGPCLSLRAAINQMQWLVPANEAKMEEVPLTAKEPAERSDYDGFKGGNFDTFLKKGGLSDGKVIRHDDRVVKELPADKKTPVIDRATTVTPAKKAVGQNPVRQVVSSSTTPAKTTIKAGEVIQMGNNSAIGEIPLKNASVKTAEKRKTFTVDASTRPISDDPMTAPTAEELRAMTGGASVTASADPNQGTEARVIKKVGGAKITGDVEPAGETVVVKKVGERPKKMTVEGVTLTHRESKENPGKAQVSGDAGLGGETTVVKKGLKTASNVKVSGDAGLEGETSVVKTSLKASTDETPKTTEKPNYLSMLPDTWGDLSLDERISFIKTVTDPDFLNFIMDVEGTPAVVNACKERLKEIESTSNG